MGWRQITVFLLVSATALVDASILPGDHRHHEHHEEHHQQGYPQTAADPPKFYAPPSPPPSLYNAPAPPIEAASETKPAFALPAPVVPTTVTPPTTTTMMMMDASYNFGYSGDQSSRAESADPSGNVVGTYAYTSPDGNQLEVRYSAGAETGFVVENQAELDEFLLKSAAAAESNDALAVTKYSGELADNLAFRQATINENDWTPNSDWAFSYDSSTGSRSEQASQEGGVEGSYTTVGADGQLFEVRYRSGPEIGFVILNEDEVAANTVPALSEEHHAAIAANREAHAAAVAANFDAASAAAAAGGDYEYDDAAIVGAKSNFAPGIQEQASNDVDYDYEDGVYSPYAFNFQSGEDGSTRSESAGEDGVVRGEYSYLSPAGSLISVRYSAGPNQGFVVENADELAAAVEKATYEESAAAPAAASVDVVRTLSPAPAPSAPIPLAQPERFHNGRRIVMKKVKRKRVIAGTNREAAASSSSSSTFGHFPFSEVASTKTSSPFASANLPVMNEREFSAHHSATSFSYSSAGDQQQHSREEQTDSSGEVTGQYSYVTPEGRSITVKYKAGKNGFEILNPEEVYPEGHF